MHDYDDCWDDECEECYEEGYDEGWSDGRRASRSSRKKPASSQSSEGCYIATAVYGTYDCPEVWVLRRFRDDFLAQKKFGRAFIRVYYATSPTLVKCFGKSKGFKNFWTNRLDYLVQTLQSKGVDDSPYKDTDWR